MFYIGISNGLLKDGHRKRMGAAVWEFMWLIDKVTKIDDKGMGKVLGGKPIKLDEISDQLGVHRDTVSDNLSALEREGYITKKNAPYGLIIGVNKAKKRFGKNSEPLRVKRLGENAVPRRENTEPISEKTPNLIKTVSVDNTDDTTSPRVDAGKEIAQIIFLFKEVNPSVQILYGRPNQRRAVERLLKLWGREKLENTIKALPRINAMPYAPIATTPLQLEEKAGRILAFMSQHRNKIVEKVKNNVAII